MLMLAALPAGLIGFWLTGSDWGAIVGVGMCAAMAVAYGTALALAQCPQCRNLLFLGNTGWINVWASQCTHCGLRLSTRTEQDRDGVHAPENNKMQLTRSGHPDGGPRS